MMEDNVRKTVYIYVYILYIKTISISIYMTGSLCCSAEIDRTL